MKKTLVSVLILLASIYGNAQSNASMRNSSASVGNDKYGGFSEMIKSETINGEIPEDYPVYRYGADVEEYKKKRIAYMTTHSEYFTKKALEDNRVNVSGDAQQTEQEYLNAKYNLDRFVIKDEELIKKSEVAKEKKAAVSNK